MEGHAGDNPCEFFVRLHHPPHRRLCLPTPFAREMELDPPRALRLHMRGRGNSGTWIDVEFPAPHVMYLHQGWKTFARLHSLTNGLSLHFKLMEGGLLSVKIFGHFGTRVPLIPQPLMRSLSVSGGSTSIACANRAGSRRRR